MHAFLSQKHITNPSRMRKTLEDIVNIPHPFRRAVEAGKLFRTIERESAEVSEEIVHLMGMDEWYARQGLLWVFYDIFGEKSDEYRYARNPDRKKKSRKRCFRLKTEREWKKLSFRRGVLSEFPDLLDPDKTEEYDRLCAIRGYYEKKGMAQLRDLEIRKTSEGRIVYDLSESAKREIFEQHFSDARILRKILIHGKRNDLRKREDHRCAYYDRIDPELARMYEESEIREIDSGTERVINDYYRAYGKTQYNLRIAKRLNILRETFRKKCTEAEWKMAVSDSRTLQTVTILSDSVLSPFFLPMVAGQLAWQLRGVVSKAEVEQYAYLFSHVWAASYQEYLSIQTFFSQVLSEMEEEGKVAWSTLRNRSWRGFWPALCIVVPWISDGTFYDPASCYFSPSFQNGAWESLLHRKTSLLFIAGLLVMFPLWMFMRGPDNTLPAGGPVQTGIFRFSRGDFSGTSEFGIASSIKASLPEAASGSISATGNAWVARCAQACYSADCALQKADCFKHSQ